MSDEKSDWILVDASGPEAVRSALMAQTQRTSPRQPRTHRALIGRVDDEHYSVRFDPPLPPHGFVRLLGGLDTERDIYYAVGWLTAPGTRVRYHLTPEHPNTGRDVLLGRGDDGVAVAVYRAECALRRISGDRAVRAFRKTSGSDEPMREPVTPAAPLVELALETESSETSLNSQFAEDRMVLFDKPEGEIVSLEEIDSSIRHLDDWDVTEAHFFDTTGRILLHIAGGAGNYLVSLTWPKRVLNLAGPDGDELVKFVAANQMVEVPRSQVADLATALQAARYFARTGEPDPSLEWYKT